MFEKLFQRPDEAGVKSPITAAEELIQTKDISMKSRLIDPTSTSALELLMFDLASDMPSMKQLMLVEALKKDGWTYEEAKGWVATADSGAAKALAKANDAADIGGRSLQVRYLRMIVKAVGIDDTYLTDEYVLGPSDYLFFWINVKKINNVAWNGKGRLEFLQALIGSMFLQSQTTQAALDKISQG